jgi:hypothetical protein
VPFTNFLVTVFTKVTVTEAAEPIFIHEPFTFPGGTLSHKLFGWFTHDELTSVSEAFQLSVTLLHVLPKIQDVLGYRGIQCDWDIYSVFVVKFYETLPLFIDDEVNLSHGLNSLDLWLGLWHAHLFPIKEDRLTVTTKFGVPKIAGTPRIHVLTVPGILTTHTVWVI